MSSTDPESNREIIDLTMTIDAALPGASVQPFKSIASEGWRATTLELYSHCGTHMDATCHFLPEGETLDKLRLASCVGVARVVDLTPTEPSELLSVAKFENAIDAPLKWGERLLLRTDWHHRYPDDSYRHQLPRISVDLANYFVSHGVRLIGVEAPSVADVNNLGEVTEVHQILFRGGIVIVEGLTNLDMIPTSHCEFIALPLKIADGDGCPVRAIATVPADNASNDVVFGFNREASS